MLRFRCDDDIICANSTPAGRGGIAVIRVSGPGTYKTLQQVLPFVPASPESHRIYFGTLRDPSAAEAVDEVLASCFAEGRSFTGQETVEISYHGNPTLGARILRILIAAGARTAEPGEFTYRAFINGKIDLIQAEAILALIESRSDKAAREALNQLKGAVSRTLVEIEDQLTYVMANMEANLDFAQEDIQVAAEAQLLDVLEGVQNKVANLLAGYRRGRILKSGFRVAIMGSPNVGKSSLLNRLLGEDRAIVTDIPGTTRDIVMGELAIAGVAVQFLDTAGFRPTEDVVENAGIQRSREAAAQADVIWWIEDATLSDLSEDMKNHESAMPTGLTVTRVLNKVDLVEADQVADHARQGAYLVSAKTGAGVEELLRSLEIRLEQETEDAAPALMQARQVEMLEQAQGALARGVELLKQSASPEFVLADIQEALFAVMTISGKKFDDDVMDRVFREFCLGK